MKVIYLRTENPKEDTQRVIEYLEKNRQGKILLVNLFQEGRIIENGLKVEDFMVYNSYDYFKNICDFEKAVCEFEDDFHILPSTIKKEEIKVDLGKLIQELKDLDDEDYSYDKIFVLYSKDDLLDLNENYELVDFSKKDEDKRVENIQEEKVQEEKVEDEAKEDLQQDDGDEKQEDKIEEKENEEAVKEADPKETEAEEIEEESQEGQADTKVNEEETRKEEVKKLGLFERIKAFFKK